jgi:hypothetical protein
MSANDVTLTIRNPTHCALCGKKEDLRFAVCFDCSDKVSGEQINRVKHLLWETANRSNEFVVVENHTFLRTPQ